MFNVLPRTRRAAEGNQDGEQGKWVRFLALPEAACRMFPRNNPAFCFPDHAAGMKLEANTSQGTGKTGTNLMLPEIPIQCLTESVPPLCYGQQQAGEVL